MKTSLLLLAFTLSTFTAEGSAFLQPITPTTKEKVGLPYSIVPNWLIHDRLTATESDGHFIPKETRSVSYSLTFPTEHKGMKLSSLTLSSTTANNESVSCRLGGRVDGKDTHFADLCLTPDLANRSEVFVAYGNPQTGEEACFVVSLKHHAPTKDSKTYNITGRK